MTEEQVAYLCSIASNLTSNSEVFKRLRSYYLMRCIELTKGYGLPMKHFSTKVRCPHCHLEWTKDTEVKVQPLKLNKKQRKKMRSQVKTEVVSNSFDKNRILLHSNNLVQVCAFCKQSTTTHLMKPEKECNKSTILKELNLLKSNNQNKQNKKILEKKNSKGKTEKVQKGVLSSTHLETSNRAVMNVYSNAFDVFSLQNKKNTLSSAIKEPTKVIKNNKKKRDKFAGLCQKAVLASAILKQHKVSKEQTPKNKLNLFLKPSPGL